MSENWQEFQFSTADGMSSMCFFGTMPLKRVRLSGSWTYAAVRLTGPEEPSDEFDPGLALAADQHFDAKGWLEVLR